MKFEEEKNSSLPDNLRLRGGVYHADFRVGGRRFRCSLETATLIMAKQRLKNAISAALNGEMDGVHRRSLTVGEWVEEYIQTHLVNRVERSYVDCSQILRKEVVPYLGTSKRIDEISTATLVRLRSECWGRTKPATQNRKFALVKHLMSEGKRRKLIKDDPARDVGKLKELPKKSRTLTDLQLKKVLLASGEPFRSYILFAVSTGLRKSELVKLRRKNVEQDPTTGCYFLRLRNDDGFRTKNGRDRRVPVHPRLVTTLLSRLGKGEEQLLFKPTESAQFYEPRGAWQRVRAELELNDVTLHGLRRTFGTILHRNNVPLGVIQELMGHSSIQQTRAYIDSSLDELTAGVRGLDQTLESLSMDFEDETWSQNGHKVVFQG